MIRREEKKNSGLNRYIMIERVTVVKFRVNYRGGNGAGCFEVEVWADTAKFTDGSNIT